MSALVMALALGVLASSAFAAQNVANASQKGSLLVFPLIDVREGNTTIIRIANDANVPANIKCYYVNETKYRVDFVFKLTKKQAVTWDALTGITDVIGNVQPFPVDVGAFPTLFGQATNPQLGELICFAVDGPGSQQVSHNHLSGTATVGNPLAGSYEYNSWNFVARVAGIGTPVGAAGRLDLTGAAGGYDACPAYNIAHVAPTAAVVEPPAALVQRFAFSLCAQDLRQDYTPHFTKLVFNIWNGHETKFTGAWECSDSTHSFLSVGLDVEADNLSSGRLGTDAAQAQILGVASTQCRPPVPFVTENVGLVGVVARVLVGEQGEIALHGTTTNHAGVHAVPGFVLWDPQESEVPEAPRR
jgi:hypothetical protein